MSALRIIILVACVVAAGASATAQPAANIGTGVENLGARLGDLEPSRPLEYFLLAEEVAAEIRTDEGRALALRLAALSYSLAGAGDDPESVELARSVCVLLLEEDLLPGEDERRYVRALRDALDDRVSATSPGPRTAEESEQSTAVALELATALGEYRAGRFREAQELLERPEVRSLLAVHAPTLRGVGVMLRDIESRPSCRECKNRRTVRDDVNPDAERRLCRTCGGDPSPAMAPVDMISSLRTESLLLGGEDSSWSARIAAGRVEPFVDVDPARLAQRLGVATDRTLWREGGWVAPGERGSRE